MKLMELYDSSQVNSHRTKLSEKEFLDIINTKAKNSHLKAKLVPFFILAGVIESYITRYADAMPVVGALCIGISAVGVIGYFIVYPVIIGRRQKLNEGEID